MLEEGEVAGMISELSVVSVLGCCEIVDEPYASLYNFPSFYREFLQYFKFFVFPKVRREAVPFKHIP